MGTLFDRAVAMGVGFTHCVSVGNQADLELCDFVEFLVDDPDTAVICSYIEGIKSPARFRALAARARAAGKPWLVVKAGRTAAGQQAAFSHTASLAGDFAALEAVCRAENVVLLDDVFAMLLLAAAMARHPGHRVRDTVLLSTSGGSAALSADKLAAAQLPMTRFDADTRARLATLFVPGQADNPVDLFGAKVAEVPDFAYQSTRLAMADPRADLCLAVITTAPNLAGMAAEIARAADEAGKPVIHVMQPARLADGARAVLAQAGQPLTDGLGEAVEAVRAWSAWSAWQPAQHGQHGQDGARLAVSLPPGATVLDEAAAKALLALAGIPVNAGVVVADAEAARQAAPAVGFPLALKVVSPDIVHKSEVGGVALNLRSAQEVADALGAMAARIAAGWPRARIEGWFLQRMAGGEVELLVGARRDPQFGPMVVVGSGGVLVELLRDVVLLPAPVSAGAARAALASLKLAPLFAGYRGGAPVDLDAAVDVLVRFGALAAQMGERDFEIEVNPLKLGADGCVAVDARARFGEEPQ
ncbi:acetate--CoA ligase family protein [Cupriavidus sp. 30B13]|uniref:acetate--CoA ligase family protein n=1 Tax=Cupriavidus sp. 30B13 TaxID=3384241 RepID=UPI003B8F24CF